MRDPCGIHVSAEVRGYMQDTYMIHHAVNTIHKKFKDHMKMQMYLDVSWCIFSILGILMYLDVSWCILMYLDVYERDISRYTQDTLKIHWDTIRYDTYLIGNVPKITIGNLPSPPGVFESGPVKRLRGCRNTHGTQRTHVNVHTRARRHRQKILCVSFHC